MTAPLTTAERRALGRAGFERLVYWQGGWAMDPKPDTINVQKIATRTVKSLERFGLLRFVSDHGNFHYYEVTERGRAAIAELGLHA